MDRYLSETRLLDFCEPAVVELIRARGWAALPPERRIGALYDYVQNEILFGYNESDDIPASRVLLDGYGQCNTKGTLLMALLRARGVSCRLHGFTIDKRLQRGALTGAAYWLAPRNILHSWVEVLDGERWVNLEGFILDRSYLQSVQQRFTTAQGPFCGYAIATADLRNPPVAWCGRDTYIQRDGINQDYGVFDAPDDFYARHGSNLSGVKRLIFRHVVRHRINARVSRIRRGRW